MTPHMAAIVVSPGLIHVVRALVAVQGDQAVPVPTALLLEGVGGPCLHAAGGAGGQPGTRPNVVSMSHGCEAGHPVGSPGYGE
jgi:hypothetical protein